MSTSLNALLTQLQWKKNEATLKLKAVEHEQQIIREQIAALAMQCNHPNPASNLINPELEVNRMNFIIQCQQQKDDLNNKLQTHQQIMNKLQEQLTRIKVELTMLEKYLARQKQHALVQQKKKDDQLLIEWAGNLSGEPA